MSILGALLGYGLVKSACNGATAWSYKQYDKGTKEIENKYRCDGFARDNRFSVLITPMNPRYVEYIKEINAYRANYGYGELMSIEKAESERKRYLEMYTRAGKIDSAGYVLDLFGKRCN